MQRCWKCSKKIQTEPVVCRICDFRQGTSKTPKPNISIGGVCLVIGLLLVAAITSRSYWSMDANAPMREVKQQERSYASPAAIDASIYKPYNAEAGSSKNEHNWGAIGFARVQALREAAAESVARNSKCDVVEFSEISDMRSRPPTKPVVFVGCANGERFFLGENDVHYPSISEKEKGERFSRAALIARCTEEVREKLSLLLTRDLNIFSISDYLDSAGRPVIQFDFQAGNSIEAASPARTLCIMTTQGTFEVTIPDE